jgi:hypothetical protein
MTAETGIIYSSSPLFINSNVKEIIHHLVISIAAKLKNWFTVSIIVTAIAASIAG